MNQFGAKINTRAGTEIIFMDLPAFIYALIPEPTITFGTNFQALIQFF